MPLTAVTHSGRFHADDALAWALLTTFFAPKAVLVRTRDQERIEAADLAFDVGGRHAPESMRFDHHQPEYDGPLSSAGMILEWLVDEGHVAEALAQRLADELVDYVDAVDNGRREPPRDVPCITRIVEFYSFGCETPEELDRGFDEATHTLRTIVERIALDHEAQRHAEAAVVSAMRDAERRGSNLLLLDPWVPWERAYFSHGGTSHPTEFVVHPGAEEGWRIKAIPPSQGSFDQKRPLPEDWAGLRDEALCAATGVEDAIFCHKNRFVAVFGTRDGALRALMKAGLVEGDDGSER